MNIRIKMEKLINLLRERKPNFDENHILDYMYSQWTIFIKDWKPVYAYDEHIFPNTELMIISKKECFIKRLVENDKIDLWEKLFNLTKNDNRKSIICDLDNNDFSWEDTFLMLLSISSSPIDDLISYLK